jgi:hypothetical protein
MRFWLLMLCGVLVSPLLFAQESALIIPRSPEEMRKFMDGSDARCPGCGVVTNVRQTKAKGQGGSAQDDLSVDFSGDLGPDEHIQPLTVFSTNPGSNDAGRAPARNWLVTVRYDDGSYAAFEQDTQPSVRKGDRVQVVAGQVRLR